MHRLGDFFIVALLALGVPCFAQADALKRAGRAVHGGDREEKTESGTGTRTGEWRGEAREERHHHHHDHHRGWRDDDDEDDEAERALGRAAIQVVLFPWTLPAAVIGEYTPDGYSIPVYPYADEVAYTVSDDPAAPDTQRVVRLGMRLGATARSPQLVSGTFATQLDFSLPFSIHLDYRLLAEADGGTRSYAGLGNAELLYRFAEARPVRFFTGAGYVQWADTAGLGHGFGIIYGFEAYPVKPISFGSRVSIGRLGDSYAFQWRSHVGVLLSRYELQLAYDHVDVGGTQLGGLQLSIETHL